MNTHHIAKRQGVALVTTLMICAMLMVIVASILAWVVSERRLSYRAAALVEARNAAEGIAEFGFAKVANLSAANSIIFSEITADQQIFMTGKSDALALPSMGFFNGSRVVQSGGLAPELLAGKITKVTNNGNAELYKYVSTVNNNDRDSAVRDRWVERRDIRILAKASVNAPGTGGPVTSYVEERISVRGSPLFTAAIFYNMDLELHPGPNMKIGGPVVVNGNLFVNKQSADGQLEFMGPVTVSGDLFRAWKSFTGWVTSGSSSEDLRTGEVKFLESGTATKSMKDGSGIWRDSTYGETSTWYATTYLAGSGATNQATWNALLKKEADDHIAEFSANAQTVWKGNVKTRVEKSPFAGIADYKEQTLGTTAANDDSKNGAHTIIEPVLPSGDTNYDAAIEKQKYATKAGLTIIVDPASGALSVKAGSTTTALSTLPAGVKKLAVWNPYATSGTPGTNTGTVTGGMYDARQDAGQNLVELDYGVLRTITTELSTGTSSIPGLVTTGWTGVVYVEVQGGPVTKPDGTIASAGTTAALKTSVRIRNGKNSTTAGTPSYGTKNPGLTIATNAPVYILGHFNADGSQTGGDTSLTNADTGIAEQPAAIVGDAVTILSPKWEEGSDISKGIYTTTEDKRSNRTKYFGDVTGSNKAANLLDATNSEISAAIITGLTPTNKNGANVGSGGAHNLLRYLEDWNDTALNTVRGSLVCLYESRVHNKRFLVSDYYRPPLRQWGLNGLFVSGKFPPGTPLAISFRRGYFRELSAQEYATAKAAL